MGGDNIVAILQWLTFFLYTLGILFIVFSVVYYKKKQVRIVREEVSGKKKTKSITLLTESKEFAIFEERNIMADEIYVPDLLKEYFKEFNYSEQKEVSKSQLLDKRERNVSSPFIDQIIEENIPITEVLSSNTVKLLEEDCEEDELIDGMTEVLEEQEKHNRFNIKIDIILIQTHECIN